MIKAKISVEGITTTPPELQCLHLSGCCTITETSLDKMLLKLGGRLVEQNLIGTRISFEGITATLPQLQRLNLSGCGKMTDKFVQYAAKMWRQTCGADSDRDLCI